MYLLGEVRDVRVGRRGDAALGLGVADRPELHEAAVVRPIRFRSLDLEYLGIQQFQSQSFLLSILYLTE